MKDIDDLGEEINTDSDTNWMINITCTDENEAHNLLLSLFGVIKSVCEHDYMRRGGPAVYYFKCIECGKIKM